MYTPNALKLGFDKLFETNGINEITKEQIVRITECCTFFETKNSHAEALNTPYLGVVPIYFTTTDVSIFLDIFNLTKEDITTVVQSSDVISSDWFVLNDVYNQLIVYVAHRILISPNLKQDYISLGLLSVFKLLHYKLFTSIVYNSYRFGASQSVMEATINSLSNKYDIIRYGTWKAVIEERAKSVYADESIHQQTLLTYNSDKDICYVLSDIQSRLRQKIVLINRVYYELKEKGDTVGDYSLVDTIDGEMILTQTSNVFDTMTNNLLSQIQSPARFIDYELVTVLADRFSVSPEMFRQILISFSDLASRQSSDKSYKEKVYITNKDTNEKEEVYAGCGLLLSAFIQKSYRLCILGGVNMSSKKAILIKVINIYNSSRTSDPDILTIKRSSVYFVSKYGNTIRPATIAKLSSGLLIYLLMRSFEYI
jgi:hypothetical protein